MILGNNYSIPIDDKGLTDPFLEFLQSFNEDEGYTKVIPSQFLYDLKRGLGTVAKDLLPKYKDCFTNEVRGKVFQTWHIDYDDNLYPTLRLTLHRNKFLAAPLMNEKPVSVVSIGIDINEKTT